MEPPRGTKRPLGGADLDKAPGARLHAAYDFAEGGGGVSSSRDDTGFLDENGTFVERAARGGTKEDAWLDPADADAASPTATATKRARRSKKGTKPAVPQPHPPLVTTSTCSETTSTPEGKQPQTSIPVDTQSILIRRVTLPVRRRWRLVREAAWGAGTTCTIRRRDTITAAARGISTILRLGATARRIRAHGSPTTTTRSSAPTRAKRSSRP